MKKKIKERTPDIMIYIIGLIFSFASMTNYPLMNVDEGFNLYVIVEYFTQTGSYLGHQLDYIISTGPTMLIPVIILYELFGPGLYYARLVASTYFFLSIYSFYKISKYLINTKIAFLISIVYISVNYIWGRRLMGEYAALFFLFLALYYFLIYFDEIYDQDKIVDKNAIKSAILFCLAFLTKSITGLYYGSSFILLFMFLRNNKLSYLKLLFYGTYFSMVFLLWNLILIMNTGIEIFNSFRERSASHLIDFHLSIEYFFEPYLTQKLNIMLQFLPILFWGLIRLKNKGDQNSIIIFKNNLLWVNSILFLSFYVIFDIGWDRHFYQGFPVVLLFAGKNINSAVTKFLDDISVKHYKVILTPFVIIGLNVISYLMINKYYSLIATLGSFVLLCTLLILIKSQNKNYDNTEILNIKLSKYIPKKLFIILFVLLISMTQISTGIGRIGGLSYDKTDQPILILEEYIKENYDPENSSIIYFADSYVLRRIDGLVIQDFLFANENNVLNLYSDDKKLIVFISLEGNQNFPSEVSDFTKEKYFEEKLNIEFELNNQKIVIYESN